MGQFCMNVTQILSGGASSPLSSREQWLERPSSRVYGECALSRFIDVRLSNPMNYSPPGSSAHGILQTKMLKGVVISSSRKSSHPGIEPESLTSPALAGKFFTASAVAGKGTPSRARNWALI